MAVDSNATYLQEFPIQNHSLLLISQDPHQARLHNTKQNLDNRKSHLRVEPQVSPPKIYHKRQLSILTRALREQFSTHLLYAHTQVQQP